MNLLIEAFFRFFSVGLFAVGGGLATLPFLYSMSAATGWFSAADISNMIAISESTPGPIGINMATYVGFQIKGFAGALISPLGLVCPSVIVIIIISKILKKFKDSPIVNSVFYGLRPASTALIAAAGIGVVKIALLNLERMSEGILYVINYKAVILAVAIWFGLKKFKKHPIVYLVIAAAAGVIFRF